MQPETNKDFFIFTKKEKRGIIGILAIIICIVIAAKYIYPLTVKNEKIDASKINALADSLNQLRADTTKNYYPKNEYSDNGNYSPYDNSFSGDMFYFDPNTLDETGWKKLGLRDKTIATILNYVSKGGKFKEPDDIRKIWGLRDDEKDRLMPYIRIAETQNKTYSNNNYAPYEKKEFEKKAYEKKSVAIVDVNAADSNAFITLPGIGAGYSRRIIKFRERLGGFYKVEQVAETFGLPDSTFQKIKPYLTINGSNIKKININSGTEEELTAHPYIRWQLAKVITEYKKQHGSFKTLQDLKKIMLINEETYSKIFPYLTL